MKAMRSIKEHGEISRKEHVKLAAISPKMVHLDLTDMVNEKLLAPAGKGKTNPSAWFDRAHHKSLRVNPLKRWTEGYPEALFEVIDRKII